MLHSARNHLLDFFDLLPGSKAVPPYQRVWLVLGDARFEKAGLTIVGARMLHLTREQAEGFYAVHKERPFFAELVDFMTSGPVMVQVLEGDDAVAKNREIMGATNPAEAAPGTVRAEFAESVGENSVHGSDAPETAAVEIAYFFSGLELVG